MRATAFPARPDHRGGPADRPGRPQLGKPCAADAPPGLGRPAVQRRGTGAGAHSGPGSRPGSAPRAAGQGAHRVGAAPPGTRGARNASRQSKGFRGGLAIRDVLIINRLLRPAAFAPQRPGRLVWVAVRGQFLGALALGRCKRISPSATRAGPGTTGGRGGRGGGAWGLTAALGQCLGPVPLAQLVDWKGSDDCFSPQDPGDAQ